MKVIRGITNLIPPRRPSCLTIGMFDGVHLGHQAIIKRLVEQAARCHLASVVITFERHPRLALGKGSIPPLLTSTPHKLHLLRELGVTTCLLVELNEKLSSMPPTRFVAEILCQKLRAKRLVVGPRLRFGKGRRGTPDLLQRLGKKLGFGVEVVEEVLVDELPVSSTLVREKVLRGDLASAEALLGRRFSVLGRVVRGESIGRKLGYRTANLESLNEALPPPGVYAVEVVLNHETYRGALNLGWKPTFHSGHKAPLVPEVHILDFNRALYRKELEIVFHLRIRDEQRFAAAEHLAEQIVLDIEAVRGYFHGRPS